MLNAQAFLPRLIGRQAKRSPLGAVTCNLVVASPFNDRLFRVKFTGTSEGILPRVFLWAFEGELSAKRNLVWW